MKLSRETCLCMRILLGWVDDRRRLFFCACDSSSWVGGAIFISQEKASCDTKGSFLFSKNEMKRSKTT